MKWITAPSFLALLAVSGCITEPEALSPTVEWLGVATPVSATLADDTTSTDTTWVRVVHEREILSTVHGVSASFAMWESEPDPCGIEWLPDDGWPCYFVTAGTGIAIPFGSPEVRVVRFTLPSLGACELAGHIGRFDDADPVAWHAYLRCGAEGQLVYNMALEESTP